MIIYEALMRDHDRLLDMLDELVELDDNDVEERDAIVEDIRDTLIPHVRAEEAIFYNSLRAIGPAKKIVREAYQEHLEAEVLLRTIQLRDQLGAAWKDSARNLRDAIGEHVDQEENQVFPLAQELFTVTEARMMGDAFEKLKPEVQTEGLLKTSLELVANVMPPRLARAMGTLSLENRTITKGV